jgi:hypothetical protein
MQSINFMDAMDSFSPPLGGMQQLCPVIRVPPMEVRAPPQVFVKPRPSVLTFCWLSHGHIRVAHIETLALLVAFLSAGVEEKETPVCQPSV